MDGTAFSVPVPPSLNMCFSNVPGRGRVKTALYKAWIEEAGWAIASQRPSKIQGPYQAIIRLPEKTPGDIDNRAKAVLDLMVKHKITPDDRLLHKLVVERTPGIASACVSILPWEAA
jgi:Holliday junction resolvase RusA-like endonuclease